MATLNLMINFRFNACLFDMSKSSRLGQRGWPRYCSCFSDVIELLFRPLNLMVPVFKMNYFLDFFLSMIYRHMQCDQKGYNSKVFIMQRFVLHVYFAFS